MDDATIAELIQMKQSFNTMIDDRLLGALNQRSETESVLIANAIKKRPVSTQKRRPPKRHTITLSETQTPQLSTRHRSQRNSREGLMMSAEEQSLKDRLEALKDKIRRCELEIVKEDVQRIEAILENN